MWFKSFFATLHLSILSLSFLIANGPPLPPSIDIKMPALVDDCVNAITGEFIASSNDLVVVGPEPLVLERFSMRADWDATAFFDGWFHCHYSWCKKLCKGCIDCRTNGKFELVEKSGASATFLVTKHDPDRKKHIDVAKPDLPNSYTNCGFGVLSARTNMRNTKILDMPKRRVEIKAASGSRLIYKKHSEFIASLLFREEKKNTHQLRYSYEKDIINLKKVELCGKNDNVCSFFNFSYPNDREVIVESSDGQKVTYICDDSKHNKNSVLLRRVILPSGNEESYNYIRCMRCWLITKHKKPENRFKEVIYDDIGRVEFLKAPVGTDATSQTTHHFVYNRESKSTTVFDIHNNKTIFRYNLGKLTQKEHFLGYGDNSRFYSREHYEWCSKGNLIKTFIEDGSMKAATTYDYDSRGNVLCERIHGNISGNGWETFATGYLYEDDLMIAMRDDTGHEVRFSYYPGTDLLKSKKSWKDNHYLRNFYSYDDNGVLTKIIFDDGYSDDENDLTGVTCRKITYMYPRMTTPVGVPECTIEKYLDLATGKEIQLQRVQKLFSTQGRLLQEDHFDANDAYCYSLFWEYDRHGNVKKEIDAIGNITEREYDANSNLVSEYKTGHPAKINSYDFSNRLIRSEEHHSDGVVLATTHQYDGLSQRCISIDPYGNASGYSYDELGRNIEIRSPRFPKEDGSLIEPTIKKEYDIFDNEVAVHDQLGHITKKTYNIHGDVTSITYPDGSIELFEYNLDGTLKKETSRIGVFTVYERDFQDRITKRSCYSSDNQLLSEESFTYSALQMLSETDAEGKVTTYSYDYAGRLIKINSQGKVTTFEYDTWSRISKIHEWYDDNRCKTTSKEYDKLNRVIEERIEEAGKILHRTSIGYDAAGNIVRKTIDTINGPATTLTEYNSHQCPIKMTDPLGNVTRISYNYSAKDTNGSTVLETSLTDPLGNQTITTHNTNGKIALVIKRDSMGKEIAHKELFYNAALNLTCIKEKAIAQDTEERMVITRFVYDSMQQIVNLIEAEGTPEQKNTHYQYEKGQKIAIVKPNGLKILFKYDSKGRLQKLSSSDNQLNHKFQYDLADRIVSATDILGTVSRKYNAFGDLESETLSSGLCFKYSYDKFGRPTQVILPDNSTVDYAYDACNLIQVSRNDFVHSYNSYAQVGLPQAMLLPKSAGNVSIKYDLMGRTTKIESGPVREKCKYDALGNLIQAEIHGVTCNYSYDDLSQIKSETGIASNTYVNDSLYNCVVRDGNVRSFNGLNQLLREGKNTYKYDLNGNLILKNSASYTYDALDRMISSTVDGKTTHYIYDAFNRRIRKSESDHKKTDYLYQGQNEVGASIDGKIIELRILGVGKGAEIGAAIALELQGELSIPLHDHNGNLIARLNENGAVLESYHYSAFGEEKIFDGNQQQVVKSKNPWRYSSKRFDDETGFIYFGRRYYDPTTCRWTTPDPKGFDAGSNLYAYVFNKPLTMIDLYGLEAAQQASQRSIWGGVKDLVSRTWDRVVDFVKNPGRLVGFEGRSRVSTPDSRDTVSQARSFTQERGTQRSNFNSVACGVGSGSVDFALGYAHSMEMAFACMGCEFMEISLYDRMQMVDCLGRTQANRVERAASWMRDRFSVDASDPLYQNVRANTAYGLEMASYVGVGVGAVNGLVAVNRLAKASMHTSKAFAKMYNGTSSLQSHRLGVGNFKYTQTAGKHFNEIVKRGKFQGELSRPYMRSPHTINEIISAGKPTPDPWGPSGCLRWNIPGTFRGSKGTWELVLHPENEMIYHFLFK